MASAIIVSLLSTPIACPDGPTISASVIASSPVPHPDVQNSTTRNKSQQLIGVTLVALYRVEFGDVVECVHEVLRIIGRVHILKAQPRFIFRHASPLLHRASQRANANNITGLKKSQIQGSFTVGKAFESPTRMLRSTSRYAVSTPGSPRAPGRPLDGIEHLVETYCGQRLSCQPDAVAAPYGQSLPPPPHRKCRFDAVDRVRLRMRIRRRVVGR